MDLSKEDLLSIYRFMVVAREMDRAICKATGKWHPTSGEEGAIVGMYYNLPKDDVIAPHYRGSLIAYYMRGASMRKLLAGILGKETGYHKGRIISKCGLPEFNALGWLHSNVGPQIYLGTGAALTAKVLGKNYATLISFGDGTSNRGEFHECINLAASLKLPAVYACQNNQYAISMPASRGLGCKTVADRAAGYGIPGVEVDGNDVLAVHQVVREAMERAHPHRHSDFSGRRPLDVRPGGVPHPRTGGRVEKERSHPPGGKENDGNGRFDRDPGREHSADGGRGSFLGHETGRERSFTRGRTSGS
jgi:TPP-dependent pyruvate/acetoin dehydrogenase alpha subunit